MSDLKLSPVNGIPIHKYAIKCGYYLMLIYFNLILENR